MLAYRFLLPVKTCLAQLALGLALLSGCYAVAPIHVWHPPQIDTPPAAQIALAPIAGEPELARRLEEAMLAERPSSAADIAIFTAEQLVESSPIRLASTAPLNNDSLAIQAARAAGADLLLQGEILSSDMVPADFLPSESQATEEVHVNMNDVFLQRLGKKQPTKTRRLMLSWRFIDVQSARNVGSKSFTLYSDQAVKIYPDLVASHQEPAELLIAASARETWTEVAPVVAKEKVRLAMPWVEPGAGLVRRGVRAARQGNWQQAQVDWQTAASRHVFNSSAHHNLALAHAAREDFAEAKRELMLARGPFSYRLPHETLFWLDQKHRLYHQAHGIPVPLEGWAFPEPNASYLSHTAEPIDIADLPWWTAIPLVKPPHWTWRAWLSQAWPF